MTIDALIQNYGYWIVFFGAAIEGESIILAASAMAATGELSIVKIGILTFLGTLIGDQGIYLLGMFFGEKIHGWVLKKFPKFQEPMEKALDFLNRNRIAYILSFRFIYGIRIISPFIIGLQGVPFGLFSSLNVVAALVWTVLSCALGYAVGLSLGLVLGSFVKYIGLMVGLLFWVIGFSTMAIKKHRKKKKQHNIHGKKKISSP